MAPGRAPWREIGPGVFVRRYPSLDLNVGAVVGDGELLVVDTRSTYPEARELQSDLRRLAPGRPRFVVNTHAHFDHCFGNALFLPVEIWGLEGAAEALRSGGELERRRALRWLPGAARDLADVEIVPPDHLVRDRAVLRVGGRRVELVHLGRGHTDHDLVVIVPDARVLFAGDLIEQSAPPNFEDAYPLEWPQTLLAVRRLVQGPVVPGHGEIVDRAFVERQASELGAVSDAARRAHAEGRTVDSAIPFVRLPPPFARQALERAYLQLDGAI